MSLLQTETVNLLGIGTGGVQDFAIGIRERRKSNREYIPQAGANEGQDARLTGADTQHLRYDPKKTDAARFQLNTTDKAIIEGIQKLSSSLMGTKEIGRNKGPWIQKFNELAGLADSSSKGQLGKYFSDFAQAFNSRGRHIGAHEMPVVNDQWNAMLAEVNKKLDTSINTSDFTFLDAQEPVTTAAKKKATTQGFASGLLGIRKV